MRLRSTPIPSFLTLLVTLAGLLLSSCASTSHPTTADLDVVRDLPVFWAGEKGSETRTGPVLVEFWATWCGTCVQSIPHLAELERAHAPAGLSVLGVHVAKGAGETAELRTFLEERKVPYRVVLDAEGRAVNAFDVRAIPAAYLFDRSGQLVWQGSPTDAGLDAAVNSAVQGS